MAATGIIEVVLKKAGRRHLVNLALEYAAAAACVGAGGVLLLLFLGTQIMDWYWPVLLFASGLAVGLYRARRRRLSRYRVAQVVDAHLGLNDRLSTIVWFREQQHESPEVLETIERQAQERLRADDANRAIPVRMPRQAWVGAALLLAAAGMAGIRYGVLHSMDLSKPLARIDLGAFQPEPKVQAATKKSAIQERYEQQLKELGINVDDLENQKGIQPIEANIPATPEQGASADPGAKQKQEMRQPSPEGTEEGQLGEQSEGDSKESADGKPGEQDGKPGKQQAQQQKQPPEKARQGQPGSDNSLMNKMRDALANMLNKLKSPPQMDQQNASNQQQSQQQGKQGQQSQQGMQSKSKSQGEGQQGQQQEGDQDSDGQKSAADKSRAGEKNSDRPGSQDSKSGMGLSEGDKDIRDAEQLAAMGKISEIFGKRAQEITGEISVEVASGKQQLKTAWSERKALHSDTGSEVNRDEIPLAYQRYIQRYFEEVRKTPAAAKTPKAGS